MDSFLGLENITQIQANPKSAGPTPPSLLLELEPWGRSFRHNLADLLLRRRSPAFATTSAPAAFWPDVFVVQRLPWKAFAESILYHAVVVALALSLSTFFATRPQVTQARPFTSADVIYYSPSEYLPPLDTGTSHAAKPIQGRPAFAKQPILSVPPEADNQHQTIVTPPDIKLTQDVATPNIVAWGNRSIPVPLAATERKPSPLPPLPNQVVAPSPEISQAAKRELESLSQSIVAPPPDVNPGKVRAMASLSIDVVAPAPDTAGPVGRRSLNAPQASIVGPPPAVNTADTRRVGDINFGRPAVVAPAPQLAVDPQRALPTLGGAGKVVPPPPAMDASSGGAGTGAGSRSVRTRGGIGQSGQQVIPPPPSVQGSTSAEGSGRLIALGIHPAIAPPASPPEGNRRGTFAAGPDGKADAPGTPDVRPDKTSGLSDNARTPGSGRNSGAPPGLHVGSPARPATSATSGDPSDGAKNGAGTGDPSGRSSAVPEPPKTVATAAPPVPVGAPKVDVVENPSPLEMKVFGNRRLYSMTLNMPNLNSAGGSWVIRFAELNNGGDQPGQITAPVADHKVDPAYPIQLMQENVAGTVTLRAIIHADGTVGDIRVVNGADQRLDRYAAEALARWHFRPAMKNGSVVDVEAIVVIPFKPIFRKRF